MLQTKMPSNLPLDLLHLNFQRESEALQACLCDQEVVFEARRDAIAVLV